MKPILVLYATRAGQSHRVARYAAGRLRDQGFTVRVKDAKDISTGFSLGVYSAAVLAASVHAGKHQPEMRRFVRRHLFELDGMPTAFLSVSLSQATAQDPKATPDRRAQAAADVEKMISAFLAETCWCPTHVLAVAGALNYSKYNFFLRFIMKQIARRAGASTDTSRDYEFTDWKAVEYFLEDFAECLCNEKAQAS